MNERRDCLINWVHLTPEGNRFVAGALAPVIQKLIRARATADSRRGARGGGPIGSSTSSPWSALRERRDG